MLSLAVRAFDKKNDKKLAWEFMGKAISLYGASESDKFLDLYQAVAVYLSYVSTEKSLEFYYQHLFDKYANLIIKDCKVIKKPYAGNLMPDSWIEIDGEFMPVEVKRRMFDKKALEQLEGYMNYYKTVRGVAVAKELRVDLPENILFVSINELEKVDRHAQVVEKFQNYGTMEVITNG